MEADVKHTWAQDPIALLESKGTREVHGKRSELNEKKSPEMAENGGFGILPLTDNA